MPASLFQDVLCAQYTIPPGTAGPEEANWDAAIPVKDSQTRSWSLTLPNGHGRYAHVQ